MLSQNVLGQKCDEPKHAKPKHAEPKHHMEKTREWLENTRDMQFVRTQSPHVKLSHATNMQSG